MYVADLLKKRAVNECLSQIVPGAECGFLQETAYLSADQVSLFLLEQCESDWADLCVSQRSYAACLVKSATASPLFLTSIAFCKTSWTSTKSREQRAESRESANLLFS